MASKKMKGFLGGTYTQNTDSAGRPTGTTREMKTFDGTKVSHTSHNDGRSTVAKHYGPKTYSTHYGKKRRR